MMNPRYRLGSVVCGVIVLLLTSATILSAQIGREYTFETSTDTYTSITSGNEVISGTTTSTYGTFDESRTAGPFNIGFDFVFNCATYTQFTVATGGYMLLGSTTYGTTANNLNGSAVYPVIAPLWDHQHMYDGGCSPSIDPDIGVYYEVTGTAPNRVLTVEWRTQFNSGGTYYWYNCTNGPLLRYKARLYEGTNKIELQYGQMYQGLALSASIGIAASSTNFYSVSPGAPPTASSTTANNAVNLASTGIQEGLIYQFTPNKLLLDGRTGTGNEGVANLKDNDTLLRDVLDLIGETNSYTPIDVKKSCGIASLPVRMSITGPDASSYSFNATGNQNYNPTITTVGAITPGIKFAPLHGGIHDATLSVTNALSGAVTTYRLLAEAEPRLIWFGNLADGGTPDVRNGDTLINGVQVVYGNMMTWKPLTIENILKPGVAPPANIRYTLNDPTGNYSINMTSDAIDGGEQSTPEITFHAINQVGYQEATLRVEGDGDIRTYLLRAFAAAPGGELHINGVRIDSNSQLFVNDVACVGEGFVSYEVTAVNTGSGDFIVNGFSAFATDTVIGQGTPPYPLLRDPFGQVIPFADYYISHLPPNAAPPVPNAPFELIIPENQSRTFRLTMIPTAPGRRYGRIYFQTNGFNLNERDVNGVETQGVVGASVFGRGLGSRLAGGVGAGLPKGVAFGKTEVRETRLTTTWIYNNGECDLRINKKDFRFEAGDIDEFELMQVLPNTQVDGDDYLLPPGYGDSVVFAFTPKTYGSRLATVRLVTNDSTLGGNGVVERGVYYLDVFGVGNIGLEARDLRLSPAVIGGEGSSGFILLENTSPTPIIIETITINGGAGEIIEDGAKPWPTLPMTLQPGEQLRLWVTLQPDPAGTDGERSAVVEVQIKGGDLAKANVSGYAGTRTIAASSAALFTNTKIGLGELARSFVALTNTGTLPVRLDNPVLSGANKDDYRVGPVVRRVLEAGQTEIFEVTYVPLGVGASTGQLSFGSNATNGAQVVQLGGEASSTVKLNDPNGSSVQQETPGVGLSRVSVEGKTSIQALVPNPATSQVTLHYRSATEVPYSIGIYNEKGDLVLTILERATAVGEFSEIVDLSSLPTGRYFVQMNVGGKLITEPLNLVR
ncbi:MAG: choice-of-anchor D domain-containing protein [Ignavibacteriae bacterium]|nr:choice-of-anchor D domain-containing protein [Ignavibacteriota bacterium]MCB9216526.1 choice-of-anchor D domain-containing protein [Ignavibacteria bacterium]